MAEVKLILKADNSDYVRKVKEAQQSTQKLHDTSQQGMKREKGLIEDIENELSRLQERRKKAFTFEEVEKYNKKIAEAKQSLKEYDEAGVKVEKTTASMTQGIGKWVLSLGGATAVLGLLTKALKETENGLKFFNIAAAVTKQLLYDIVTGAGLAVPKLIEAAKISNELNKLRIEERYKTIDVSKALAEYNKLRTEAYDRTKSDTERADIMRQAIEKYNEVAKIKARFLDKELTQIESLIKLRPEDTKLLDQQATIIKEIYDLASDRERQIKELQSIETSIIKQQTEEREQMFKDWHTKLQDAAKFEIDTRKKLNDEIIILGLAGLDKELEQLKQKYEQDVENFGVSEGLKNLLLQKYLLERTRIIEKWEQEELEKLKKEIAWALDPDAKELPTDPLSGLEDELLKRGAEIIKTSGDIATGWNDAITATDEAGKADADNRRDKLRKALQAFQDVFDTIARRAVEDAQRRRELLDTQISEIENELQTEAELYAAGYAANVSLKKKELEDLKKVREQALKDEEEAIKRQRAMESIAQGVNIFTSATQILKAFTKNLGPIGLALAAGAITAMFALVANWKSKSSEVTKLAVGGSGDTGTIKGRSHARGGERFLDHVEVEGGESWGVLSVPATKKFGKIFHHMVSSFNKGEIPQIAGSKVSNNVLVDNNGSNSRLDQVIAEQKKLNNKLSNIDSLQDLGSRVVIKKGSTVRVIKR